MTSNPFEAALARERGRLGRLATSVSFFPAIGSTNDHALALGTEGAIVIADAQTAGRGRRGHSWYSPPGSGLYVSVVLAPYGSSDPRRAVLLLTIAAGAALAEGIQAATGLPVMLKWPNDLFVERRKLGGILAESINAHAGGGAITVGYGINVSAAAFPPELATAATSLESECGRAVDRVPVLVETLAALAARYDDLLAGRFDAILDGWRRRAPAATGARVRWSTSMTELAGTTAGIDEDGALLVRTDDDRLERIIAGEIRWM